MNDTDNLPIQEIVIDDWNNIVNVYLTDGTGEDDGNKEIDC